MCAICISPLAMRIATSLRNKIITSITISFGIKTKAFVCLQVSLERHVNNHFNNSEGSQSGSSKKSVENGSVKLFRRNGKRLRFRRQPWSGKKENN